MSEIRKRKSNSIEETEKLQPETESDHVSFDFIICDNVFSVEIMCACNYINLNV